MTDGIKAKEAADHVQVHPPLAGKGYCGVGAGSSCGITYAVATLCFCEQSNDKFLVSKTVELHCSNLVRRVAAVATTRILFCRVKFTLLRQLNGLCKQPSFVFQIFYINEVWPFVDKANNVDNVE